MKKIILFVTVATLTSCISIKQIGYINMISTRNISMKENYAQVKSYSGESDKELLKNKAKSVDEAVTNLVRTVPGGEFVMNAKIYIVNSEYYAVSGDVWGVASKGLNKVDNMHINDAADNSIEVNFKGFKKGDHILWQDGFIKYTGIISDLKDNEVATVKQDKNGRIRTVKYEVMQKID